MKRSRSQAAKWQQYDPSWLVELAIQQRVPQDVIDAIRRCTRCVEESRAYIYFVNPRNANQSGAEWQFDRNVRLEGGRRHGTVVLDILEDGRVGGIEFLKR